MKLRLRKFVGALVKLLPCSWGYGDCGRCHRTWNICDGHDTDYGDGWGCFPLCKECWSELTIEERLPYYYDLVFKTGGGENERHEWGKICQAVLDGK